jgi:hypothetical protein
MTKMPTTITTARRPANTKITIVTVPSFVSGSLLTEFCSTEETVEFTSKLVSFELLVRTNTVLIGGVLVELTICLLVLIGSNFSNFLKYDSSFRKY